MNSLEDFKIFYDTSLYPKLVILEKERINLRNKIIIRATAYMIISLIVYFTVIVNSTKGTFFTEASALIFFLLIGALIYRDITKPFVSSFKEQILTDIAKFINPSLTMINDVEITTSQINNTEIFPKDPNYIYISDFFEGQIDDTCIDFCELMLEKVTEDTKEFHTKITFKGFYFIADFNKNFNGTTVIVPDKARKVFGPIGEFIHQKFNNDYLVKLEDVDFEKQFAVYSNDQIESRYLLSPSLMKRILKFKNIRKSNISLSFINSNLHIAIPHSKNLFEPKIFKSIIDYSEIENLFLDFMFFIDIVNELNLNNRVWTKE